MVPLTSLPKDTKPERLINQEIEQWSRKAKTTIFERGYLNSIRHFTAMDDSSQRRDL